MHRIREVRSNNLENHRYLVKFTRYLEQFTRYLPQNTVKMAKSNQFRPLSPVDQVHSQLAPRPIVYGCMCFIGAHRWEPISRWRVLG